MREEVLEGGNSVCSPHCPIAQLIWHPRLFSLSPLLAGFARQVLLQPEL